MAVQACNYSDNMDLSPNVQNIFTLLALNLKPHPTSNLHFY